MERHRFAFSNSSEEDADIIVFGFVPGRGSENKEVDLAPESIRKASYRIYGPVYGSISGKRIWDAGDIFPPDFPRKKFLMLGGNHLSTYHAVTSGVMEREGAKDILIFDAHPDCFGVELDHGSFVKFLADRYNITIVGVSNPSSEEIGFMESAGIKWFSSREVFWEFERVMEGIPGRAYVSIDMDVFMANRGSYQAELLGLLPHHVFRLLEGVSIISSDVVEATPEGAEYAARAAVELLGLM